MRRRRNVKILATLGPASNSPDMIEALHEAGADVFRVNMSHTRPEELAGRVAMIRDVESRLGRPIGVLADLQGPKLRVGRFADGPVRLENGARFRLDLDDVAGDAARAQLPHPEIFAALFEGAGLLLDDGKIRLRVTKCGKDFAETEVVVGGPLSDRKGVNVPDAVLPIAAITAQDRAGFEAALEAEVDWVALSFVQRPEDVAEARKIAQGRVGVLSKIEKPQAVEHLQEILDLSDAIMVARGDLGVEAPLETVPGIQTRIVRACRAAGKPVVVATQMLESMIKAPSPTRAEVSDVAHAIELGADAIMLSAESAAGDFPREAVATMNSIAETVERDVYYRQIIDSAQTPPEPTSADAITAAARSVCETIGAACIVCFTKSGSTGLRAARERPCSPIIALTPSLAIARRLELAWGLHCVKTDDATSFSDMVARACDIARAQNLAGQGDRVIVTAGVPFGTPGATNTLRIAVVGEENVVGQRWR